MTTFKKFKSVYLVITVTYRVTVKKNFYNSTLPTCKKNCIDLKNGRPKTVRLEARVSQKSSLNIRRKHFSGNKAFLKSGFHIYIKKLKKMGFTYPVL